jgi:hypothetical protein
MKSASPASILRDAVEAMHRPGDLLNFLTDSVSYPDKVLLAVWRPNALFVMTIDKAEYDGLWIAGLFGFEPAPPKTAMDKALGTPAKPVKGHRK